MDTVNPNLLKSVAIIHEVAVAYIFLSCVVPPPPSGSWPWILVSRILITLAIHEFSFGELDKFVSTQTLV